MARMTTHSRRIVRASLVAALALALSAIGPGAAGAKPAGPGPGNQPNAKSCQKGGWQQLYTSTGATFTSERACTSYAANGGTLLRTPPPPPTRTLTVSTAGAGTVTSAEGGIDCGSDCSQGYPEPTSVTLTATPAAGSTFAGWSGDCGGTDATCTLAMTADRTATATFDVAPPPPFVTPDIYVGYADNFSDFSPQPFPSPWAGDPGVIFLGCTGTECGATDKYNAGAIRIDHDAANTTPLTLTDAYVDIGPCHYAPWSQFVPATALPGERLVLTQTGLLGAPLPAPCNAAIDPFYRETLNFETAIRPGDTQSSYNCASEDRPVPVITLKFDDDTTLTVTDADRVLNTGGAHRFACEGRNMTTPWTPVLPANIVAAP